MRRSIAIFITLFLSFSISAGLGDKIPLVEKETYTKIQKFSSYQIREISESKKLVIREFIRPDRTIFGIAWNGMHLPNFSKILGRNFQTFAAESSSPKRRRGPLYISTGNLVVFSGGRQRNFKGHAFLKDQVPEGFDSNEIK